MHLSNSIRDIAQEAFLDELQSNCCRICEGSGMFVINQCIQCDGLGFTNMVMQFSDEIIIRTEECQK